MVKEALQYKYLQIYTSSSTTSITSALSPSQPAFPQKWEITFLPHFYHISTTRWLTRPGSLCGWLVLLAEPPYLRALI